MPRRRRGPWVCRRRARRRRNQGSVPCDRSCAGSESPPPIVVTRHTWSASTKVRRMAGRSAASRSINSREVSIHCRVTDASRRSSTGLSSNNRRNPPPFMSATKSSKPPAAMKRSNSAGDTRSDSWLNRVADRSVCAPSVRMSSAFGSTTDRNRLSASPDEGREQRRERHRGTRVLDIAVPGGMQRCTNPLCIGHPLRRGDPWSRWTRGESGQNLIDRPAVSAEPIGEQRPVPARRSTAPTRLAGGRRCQRRSSAPGSGL